MEQTAASTSQLAYEGKPATPSFRISAGDVRQRNLPRRSACCRHRGHGREGQERVLSCRDHRVHEGQGKPLPRIDHPYSCCLPLLRECAGPSRRGLQVFQARRAGDVPHPATADAIADRPLQRLLPFRRSCGLKPAVTPKTCAGGLKPSPTFLYGTRTQRGVCRGGIPLCRGFQGVPPLKHSYVPGREGGKKDSHVASSGSGRPIGRDAPPTESAGPDTRVGQRRPTLRGQLGCWPAGKMPVCRQTSAATPKIRRGRLKPSSTFP